MILLQIQTKEYPINFIYQLKHYYSTQFLANVEIKRLQEFEKYFDDEYQVKLDAYEICKKAIDTSYIISTDAGYLMSVNTNILVDNFKVVNIVQLIDNGNLQISAYPIFSNTSTRIMNNLDNLYQLYQMGIVI